MKKGEQYKSNNGGMMTVLKYSNKNQVQVSFDDTGYTTIKAAKNIRTGEVRLHSVHDKGYLGDGKYKSSKDGSKTEAYVCWKNMLKRCYDEGSLQRNPSYRGCTVADAWLDYQVFCEWFYMQDYAGKDLDKDLIQLNNKVYSAETCCFVPHSVNSLILKPTTNSQMPVGIKLRRGKYEVTLSMEGVNNYLGQYDTIEEAESVYKEAKVCHMQAIAMVQENNLVKPPFDESIKEAG